MQLRLESTSQHGERFLQNWTIIDGDDEHGVISDSEWGDISIDEGGERLYNIAGTSVNSGQIVACAISVVPGPTEDGESIELDSAWLKEIERSGVALEYLSDPIE